MGNQRRSTGRRKVGRKNNAASAEHSGLARGAAAEHLGRARAVVESLAKPVLAPLPSA
jgi:hypothetical protein